MEGQIKIYKTENVLQADCFQWSWKYLKQTRRLIWHVPNGGARRKSEAAAFRGMGVIAGVCDMHFLWSGKLYIIELKVLDNHITDAQAEYIITACVAGAIFYECRTLEKWQSIINGIIDGEALPCEANRLIMVKPGEWAVAA